MFKLLYLFVLCVAFVVSGCGVNRSALTQGQDKVDLSKKSVALLSVKLSNQNERDWQPRLTRGSVLIAQPKSGNTGYLMNDSYARETNNFGEYWLSFELEPGINNVVSFRAMATKLDGFFDASCDASLNLEADIKPNSISYLGHIDAIIRKKQNDDEQMAASFVYPLTLTNELAGFFSGTFDIVVSDRFEEDMKTYTSQYPVLRNVQVIKSILPQWVRPEHRKGKS